MSKRVAIVQSSYIPWLGYFDLIRRVDEFILLDDVQFTKRDWRNRNFLRGAGSGGFFRLTIPVGSGNRARLINEVRSCEPGWNARHWKAISQAYARCPYFHVYKSGFERVYNAVGGSVGPDGAYLGELLSVINRVLIEAVCEALGVRTRLSWSTDYPHEGVKTERLVSLCVASGATVYLSGPSAKTYLHEPSFAARGIAVEYAEYNYAPYRQLGSGAGGVGFIGQLSVLDLVFNEGPNAVACMSDHGEAVAA